jgi:hypothetical protein
MAEWQLSLTGAVCSVGLYRRGMVGLVSEAPETSSDSEKIVLRGDKPVKSSIVIRPPPYSAE